MSNNQKWVDWLKEIPTWAKFTIGLLTEIISLIALFQGNYYLGITISSFLILVTVLFICLYVTFTKTPPMIEGGRGVYRFPKYRFWGKTGIFIVCIISITIIIPKSNRQFIKIAFVGTATPTLTPTPTPTPTATNTLIPTPTPTHVTPLAAPTATSKEILILVAEFKDDSQNRNYNATNRIWSALQNELKKQEINNVRLEYIEDSFAPHELEQVRSLGKLYNASIFIWGYYDDGGMFPHFTILRDESIVISPNDALSKPINLADPSSDFVFYLNYDLPAQVVYFSKFTIGQIMYLEQSYDEALLMFDEVINSVEINDSKAISLSLSIAYYCRGYINQAEKNNPEQAIIDYTNAIEFSPDNWKTYYNRGVAFHTINNLDEALKDYSTTIKINPLYAHSYYNQGMIYFTMGNFSKADQKYRKASQIDINYNFYSYEQNNQKIEIHPTPLPHFSPGLCMGTTVILCLISALYLILER